MPEKPPVTEPKASASLPKAVQPDEAPFRFDEYWMGRGKEFADNTLLGLNQRLQSFITFLNILAGASFLGEIGYATFLKSADWIIFGCFSVPLVISLLARFQIGIEVVRPTYRSPDLRSPIQINRAFNEIVDSKRDQLRRAQPWVLAALITFSIGFPAGLFYNNVLTTKALEMAKNKKEVRLNLFDKGFEVSGMIAGPSLDFIIAGAKTVKNTKGEIETVKTKDTLITFSREVKKDELFVYDYNYTDFGFDVESIAVKYKDGPLNRTLEQEISPRTIGQESKK